MIQFKSCFIFLVLAFLTFQKVSAQANPYIEVLPSNSGVVSVGATNDFMVVVGNTLSGSIAVSKLRPIVTIPASVNFLSSAEQTGLPAGWTILTNIPSQLRLCNSADIIGGSESRTIILKVRGVTITPPQTFTGQINFGNGTTCAPGISVSGNILADDFATSTIEVIAGPLPLTLLSFNATLSNCQPSLNWQTESEINTDRFEIERSNASNGGWKVLGTLSAKGTTASTKAIYNFSDADLNATSARAFYRLKIIDKDGSHKYSNILPVVVNCKTVQVSVFPNPVQSGKLYVSLTGTSGQAEAILMSVTGQVILRSKVNNGTQMLNVTNIPDGTYILNISDANSMVEKTKVIIQK